MPSYILDKVINVETPISKVDQILIDDRFTYVTLFEGIRIQGEISLSGTYQYENEQFPFSSLIEVDIMCPNDEICDVRALKMKVNDYSYSLAEQAIVFHLQCQLVGSEKAKEVYAIEDACKKAYLELQETPKEVTIEQARAFLSDDEARELESLLKDDLEMITTLEPSSTLHGGSSEEWTKVPSDLTMMTTENLPDDIEVELPLEVSRSTTSNDRNALLFAEKYVVSARFYRVKTGDDYPSIAQKMKVDLDKLRTTNGHKELKDGVLLVIPLA